MTDQPSRSSSEQPDDDAVPETANPYGPSTPASGSPPAGSAQSLPQPLLTAVRLMYAGAVVQVVVGVVMFIFISRLRDSEAVQRAYSEYADQVGGDAQALIDGAVTSWRIGVAVVTVALTALWLLMAWATRTAKRWARPTATGLGVLALIGSIYTVLGQFNVVAIVTGLLAAAILYLLYRPDSTAYFATAADARRP
ncbi:hypothetical protein MUG78_07210 [Gordonia alkaliphila]|uniref:hypothetical protein n=1 Tax=Gordonia alkaliphila TaxID=1053547 RepID=UPI001FF0E83C|nr:hypothetical protein [Gordonia alkaliphila]MCK0439256.1 hypothetical protein [Gordonia alkaliphila]